MEPGRELDARVAKGMGIAPDRRAIATKDRGESAAVVQDPVNGPFYTEQDVKNWIAGTGTSQGYELGCWNWYPRFSTDIVAAFDVENAMAERGWYLELIRLNGGWRANFRKWIPEGDPNGTWHEVHAFGHSPNPDTDPDRSGRKYAPLAICLAALEALGIKV